MEGARDFKGPPGLMVILMRIQHLIPETKETLVNKAHRQRLEPRVFKDLFDLRRTGRLWRPWLIRETGADRKLMEFPDEMTGATAPGAKEETGAPGNVCDNGPSGS